MERERPDWWAKPRASSAPTKRRSTRLHRSALRPHLRPYVLEPEWLYEQEVLFVLRALVKFITGRGYAPTCKRLALTRKWDQDALERYLLDMEHSGLARTYPSKGWAPTEAGAAAIHVAPVVPRYPTNDRARRHLQQQERDLAGSLECFDRARAQ